MAGLQAAAVDGLLRRAGAGVPVRARPRVHGLRRVLLLGALQHQSEPAVHVLRHHGSAGEKTSAGITNENDSLGPPATATPWTTYPERLEAAGISWKVYQDHADNFSDNSLASFRQDRDPFSAAPVAAGAARTLDDAPGATLDGLRNDVLAGALPQVSWIVAPAAYSEHPGPSSPSRAPG